MPQMSPLLWELLNISVMILLLALMINLFFFLISHGHTSKNHETKMQEHTASKVMWLW